jgi:tyrosinase
MGPADSLLPENVGQAVINQIMGETPFETFGTSRPAGQNSLDPSWIKQRTGLQGTLEGNPHNNVHGDVGGVMGGFRSANDPIFMMHHCNIDRLWWVWNGIPGHSNSAETNWSDMPFQNNFFNPNGTPFSPKVSDLYIPEQLGYTYDAGAVVATTPTTPTTTTPLDDKFKTLYAMPRLTDVKAAGLATFVADGKDALSMNEYLEIPVNVDPGQIGIVARYLRPSSGALQLDAQRARAQLASAPRALCFLRDIQTTKDADTQYRVFVDCDYLSRSVLITNRHYVGTFGFFGGSDHSHGGNPSVAVDLTRTLQRVYGSLPPPEKLRVQILPVPRGKKTGEIGTAKPGRVEVAIVSA